MLVLELNGRAPLPPDDGPSTSDGTHNSAAKVTRFCGTTKKMGNYLYMREGSRQGDYLS